MLNETLKNKIGFGGGKLSVMPTLRSALHILDAAFDNGINYFDTAPLYGSGYSEIIIGKFLKNKRDKILVATKAGLNPSKKYNLSPALVLPLNYLKRKIKKTNQLRPEYKPSLLPYRLITKEYIKSSFENSLRSLKTDYIDYYLLHEAIPSFLEDDAVQYLSDLKSKGYISKLGLAASYINYLQLDKTKMDIWDVLQYEYAPNDESKLIGTLFPDKEHNLHGVLTNKKPPEHIFPIENRAGYMLAECLKNNLADRVLFSTSKVDTLYTNIASLNLYY